MSRCASVLLRKCPFAQVSFYGCVFFCANVILRMCLVTRYFNSLLKSLTNYHSQELLAAAIDIAEEGGRELVRIQMSGRLKTSEKTGKNDLVTAGDHASHDIMYYGLKGAFPGKKSEIS